MFIFISSVCKSLWCLISALTQGGEGSHLCRFTCVVGRERHYKQILRACVGSACSVWTTLGLPQFTAACAFRVYTTQVPECPAGHYPKQALHFMHFPGLSCSGLGSWVLCKGTDSVGHAFCALPRFEQLRHQVLGKHTVPGGPCILITSSIPATWFRGAPQEHHLRCAV